MFRSFQEGMMKRNGLAALIAFGLLRLVLQKQDRAY
jgi:hypothetical protein